MRAVSSLRLSGNAGCMPESLDTLITNLDDPGMIDAPGRTDLAPSPRVSTRALLTADVALKGSAGAGKSPISFTR